MSDKPRIIALGTDRRTLLGAVGLAGAAAATGAALSGVQTAQAQVNAPSDGRPMVTRTIGRTSETLSALGLGTFLTFDLLPGAIRDHLRDITKTYIAAGVGVVDTSPLYGTGEVSVGGFLSAMGVTDRLFISNKIWSTGDFLADESHAQRSLDQSLLRLWRAKLDLMFCHSLVNVDVALPIMRAWKKEGRIRFVGASHHENTYHPILTDLLERNQLDFVQVNYSIFNRGAEERLLKAAADKGSGVFINMALEKGRLHKIVGNQPLPDFAKEFGAATWAQFFIKWVMSNPAVTTVLTGTSNPAHAIENVATLRGPLPDQAMRQRMVRHMEGMSGFNSVASLPWYPDKQSQYQGVIRRSQAQLRQRLS
ncbi:aldo/keto reductase [Bosea sp. PAMC 26642]|uniref:aldo/keto reductase n=1 Tax=Bosea sp. (strain PAMC 26642) TaxID=1792307 RepID=UPI0007704070|nr:aldo/keto reductase [Bosea sp. PAMC 26642]AMJ59941.1 oxidoreductase [Bosea sp. PAMC 26642]